MNKEIDIKDMAPVKASERHVILCIAGNLLCQLSGILALHFSKTGNYGGYAYGGNRQDSPLSSIPFRGR